MWSAPGRVPPDIARGDYELARDLLERLTESHRRLAAIQQPLTDTDRRAIDVMVGPGNLLLACAQALLDSVAMFLQEDVDLQIWKQMLERRNAALVTICMYADYPEVLDQFTTHRSFLGLSGGLDVALRGGLDRETPRDWDRSVAVGEGLLKSNWMNADSPYAMLRVVSSRLLFDRVRERYPSRRAHKTVSIESDHGEFDVDREAARLQAHWRYEDRVIAELADYAHERSAQQILASVRAKAGVEVAQYIDAVCRFESPELIRVALGWTPSRIKRVRERLKQSAKTELTEPKALKTNETCQIEVAATIHPRVKNAG